MVGNEKPEDFKEVTPSEKATIERADKAELDSRPQGAEFDTFVTEWNENCRLIRTGYQQYIQKGRYNGQTGFFELHGLTDITYPQAREIMLAGRVMSAESTLTEFYRSRKFIRTHLPQNPEPWYQNRKLSMTFSGCAKIESAEIYYSADYMCFGSCGLLRKVVIGGIYPQASQYAAAFYNCTNLEEIEIVNVNNGGVQGSGTIHLQWSPKLSSTSFQNIIREVKSGAQVTIQVHPDVMAKLTDTTNTEWHQVLLDATAKNIQFIV